MEKVHYSGTMNVECLYIDNDFFRPQQEPECTFYNAIQAEARNPINQTVEEKLKRIRIVVSRVVKDYARAHNLRVPSNKEIRNAEKMAIRNLDFQVKYSTYLANCLKS